jgi:hypothetical protein
MKPRTPGPTSCVIIVGKASSGVAKACRRTTAGHQPGHHDREGHQQPQPAGEDHAELAVLERFGREVALHDELVEPAVVDHHDPHAADHAGPGQVRVVGGQDHVQLVRVVRGETIPAADRVEAEEKHQQPAGQQRQPLHQVGPGDRLEPAERAIDRGDQPDQPHRLPQRHPAILRSVTPPEYSTAGSITTA